MQPRARYRISRVIHQWQTYHQQCIESSTVWLVSMLNQVRPRLLKLVWNSANHFRLSKCRIANLQYLLLLHCNDALKLQPLLLTWQFDYEAKSILEDVAKRNNDKVRIRQQAIIVELLNQHVIHSWVVWIWLFREIDESKQCYWKILHSSTRMVRLISLKCLYDHAIVDDRREHRWNNQINVHNIWIPPERDVLAH